MLKPAPLFSRAKKANVSCTIASAEFAKALSAHSQMMRKEENAQWN
jgi:hypothetical protein